MDLISKRGGKTLKGIENVKTPYSTQIPRVPIIQSFTRYPFSERKEDKKGKKKKMSRVVK